MPDIIEDFFQDFGNKASDFYELISLNPQFEMIFTDDSMNVPENYGEMIDLFENLEQGAGNRLEEFMKDAAAKYEIGMKEFVVKPCHSWIEFISPKIAKNVLKLDLLTNFSRFVRKYFSASQINHVNGISCYFFRSSA
ncbi:hypothetical protein [Chryseobacterium indoltheticum]|uniref:hypothetical protein n=1 Tax=Chryseobacterium indoltheticum TaxID=254 RepID=UPI003F4976A1